MTTAPPPSDAFSALGAFRAIDSGTASADLSDLLGRHHAAIVQSGGTLVRQGEALARMEGETQKLLRKAKSEGRAEWVPGGDSKRMDARYLREDGSVLFGRVFEDVEMPNGTVEKVVRHGFLSDPFPVVAEQLRARNAHSSLTLAMHRAKRMNLADPWADPFVRKSFLQFRKAMQAVPGQTGEFLRTAFGSMAELKRVISNTANSGAELILVPTMANLRRPADLARRIPGLFRTREVASPSFKQPIVTGRALATRRGATTNTPAQYPVSDFVSGDTTLTVVDQVIMALIDPLWVSDASLILEDPMGFVLQWLESGYIDSLELAMLHGDTGTHQDAISSWTMGGLYTAGRLDGTNAATKWWKGVRARAYDDSNNISAGGSFDIADHFAAVEAMGNHGNESVAITGLHCLYTQVLPYSGFTTVDKMGALATQITGEIGKLGKSPLIISEMVPNDFANTGLYTGSGTTTEIVYVDPTAYEYYEYSGGADDFDQLYPDKGAQYVGMVRRGLFAPTCVDTEKPAAVSYNL